MATEYKGAESHLASGSWTAVVTAPTGKSNIIKLAQATNVTSSAATLNLAVSSSARFYLAKGVSINNGLDIVVSYLQVSSSIS